MLQELLTSKFIRLIARKTFPKQMRHTFWQRRGWLRRDNHEQEQKYWADSSKNRNLVVNEVLFIIDLNFKDRKKISILDYGSYVGTTLKLIRERVGQAPGLLDFYAVEPASSAFDFMKSRLDVNALNGNDSTFTNADNWPPSRIDIAIVNAVFYSMSQKRVLSVLHKLARISDIVIIGDEFKNLKGKNTFLGEDVDFKNQPYESLFHPWEKLLKSQDFQS